MIKIKTKKVIFFNRTKFKLHEECTSIGTKFLYIIKIKKIKKKKTKVSNRL